MVWVSVCFSSFILFQSVFNQYMVFVASYTVWNFSRPTYLLSHNLNRITLMVHIVYTPIKNRRYLYIFTLCRFTYQPYNFDHLRRCCAISGEDCQLLTCQTLSREMFVRCKWETSCQKTWSFSRCTNVTKKKCWEWKKK